MYTLVLVRHGESVWNMENRFTGWKDVDLSEKGETEAREAGRMLREKGFVFDVAYTSVLKRAIRTLHMIQEEIDQLWIPEIKTWRLNERHYGALQGLNKSEMATQYGEEQVLIWRRSYDTRPPALTPDDERFPGHSPVYQGIPEEQLPLAECLKDTVERVLPYWNSHIAPDILAGKRLIIAAHGNSLRALVKYLDGLSEAEIMQMNIPTGIPLVYELDANLKPLRHFYLADEEKLKSALEAVASQGKAKK